MFIKQESRLGSSITAMSKMLNVSRGGYYKWLKKKPSLRSQQESELLQIIRDIYVKGRYLFGSPKIGKELRKLNLNVNHKRVARIMKKYGITAIYRSKFKPMTTDSNHRYPISANLLKQDFKATEPNQVWVSDVTYIKTRKGWLYLCVVIDLFSRKVVGWSMSQKQDTKLIVKAFQMAYGDRKPKPWQLIFHSDRGSQYASHAFRAVLKRCRVISSMSRTGNCYDNACAESWFGLMKREMLYLFDDDDFALIRTAVFEYIEVFYNRQRPHGTINDMTPEEYELKVA